MLRYVFMGTPPLAATILEKLAAAVGSPAAVVTQPARPRGRGKQVEPTAVEALARRLGYLTLATGNVNDPATVEHLKSLSPDLVLVAAFGQILKNDVLALPKLFCLNVHASLLPKYRGAAPVQRAIWNGDKITGVTIQKMARKLDTGDILLQKTTAIDPNETSGELLDRLAVLGAEALIDSVRAIEGNRFSFTPQVETEATYAAKIDKADANIDWNETAQAIRNRIRALQPWPVAESSLGAEALRIFSADPVAMPPGTKPGQLTTDAKEKLIVTCGGDTALSLTRIQLPNRKKLDVKQFLMAYRGNFPHSRLGDS